MIYWKKGTKLPHRIYIDQIIGEPGTYLEEQLLLPLLLFPAYRNFKSFPILQQNPGGKQ